LIIFASRAANPNGSPPWKAHQMAIYAGHASIDAYTMGRSIRQLEMAVSIGVQALATRGGFREFRKGECLGSAIM